MPRTPGIEVRHARSCRSGGGGRCNCSPSYRAQVYLKREGKTVRKTFPTREQAIDWRRHALVAASRGALKAPTATKLKEAAEKWLEGARSGEITNRSGDPYKPAAVRGYEKALRLRVYPEIGSARFTEVRLLDLQALVDKWRADGLSPSTIDSTINPLRAIYRRALQRGDVTINPTKGLELPAIRSKPRRFASPQEAAALIAALPAGDRAIWATAFYAGLRRGELRALRVEDVDLAAGVIHVRRGWDDLEGEIAPKTAQGRRRVPIPAVLRDHLDAHELPSDPESLIFGGARPGPFDPGKLTKRADDAWEAAKLERLTLHEARHTFASLMIAAGVNAKALSTFMGHFSISITLDLYGHLMPGSEDEAAALLDRYLADQESIAAAAARSSERQPLGVGL
ncbi:MAG: site-specific integrase [Solirubrobacterales bacterium]|nr:site-specific integrase [Solirubrobacterales bacterium]MCB8970277.1 site-specific integrase [Thermoleophilales bacterium]MCB9617794.1 site-specific integrase [Sandaracinus sp.]